MIHVEFQFPFEPLMHVKYMNHTMLNSSKPSEINQANLQEFFFHIPSLDSSGHFRLS